jgi:glycine oxidase
MDFCSDLLIIGSGVIGLTIARELRKRGVGKIRVLEKGQPGCEASWAAAGILAPQVEADEDDEFFRLCYESNKTYSRFADELSDETGIDIELDRRGVLYAGFDGRDETEFEQRFAWQNEAGLKVEKLSSSDIRNLEPNLSDSVRCGLLFPDDGQVENRKLTAALIAFAGAYDIEIDTGVEAKSVRPNGESIEIMTDSDTYHAAIVVIATGAWTSLIELGENALPVEVKPIRGQMICYRPTETFSRVVYSGRGYIVPRADGRLLVGATVEDTGFDKSVTADGIAGLRHIASEIAPTLENLGIIDQWAGLRPYASGGEPFIGEVPGMKNVFAAVGHYRNGILLAPITAKMIADRILGAAKANDAVKS